MATALFFFVASHGVAWFEFLSFFVEGGEREESGGWKRARQTKSRARVRDFVPFFAFFVKNPSRAVTSSAEAKKTGVGIEPTGRAGAWRVDAP